MLDSDDVFAIPSITEKSSHKITIDEMRVLFPPAPKLQKYYTVEEAVVVALCDRIVATGRPIMSMLRLKSNLG